MKKRQFFEKRCAGNIKEHDMARIADHVYRGAQQVGGVVTVCVDENGDVWCYPTGTLEEQGIWINVEDIAGVFSVPVNGNVENRKAFAAMVADSLCEIVESVA